MELRLENVIGFGGKALRKLSDGDASALVRAAFDGGMTLFSTSRAYGESERRIALGLAGVPRGAYLLSTGTRASTADALERDLAASLEALATEYIDIYKLHNPTELPSGELRAALERARERGEIRMLGISTGSLKLATAAVESGFVGAVEYPLCSLASDDELELVQLAAEKNVAILAQKPLAGGLLRSVDGAYAFLRRLGALPLWGPEYMWQLERILSIVKNPPALTPELWNTIHEDRAAFAAVFCRACGECMPCPAGIDIPFAVRISSIVRGDVWQNFAAPDVQEKLRRAAKCVGCGRCIEACPHHLPVRDLLRRGVEFYRDFLREHGGLE